MTKIKRVVEYYDRISLNIFVLKYFASLALMFEGLFSTKIVCRA